LALWRGSVSPLLKTAGARLEAALWRDIAAFYHPDLNNLCGPYDRAYGMDMTRYASLLGLWMWWACGVAAFPDPRRAFGHAHDFCATPLLAMAAPLVPNDVVKVLAAPVVARTLRRLTPDRTITATLLPTLMLGAVAPAHIEPTGQAHPVTAHWRDRSGAVAWLSILGAPFSAHVSGAEIQMHSDVELTLEFSAAAAPIFDASSWTLGGRRIEVEGIRAEPGAASQYGYRRPIRLPSGQGRLVFE
jgi:hypothetical protein